VESNNIDSESEIMHDKLTYQGRWDESICLTKTCSTGWSSISRWFFGFLCHGQGLIVFCRGKVYLEPPCVRLAVLFICTSDRASDHACVSSTQNRSVKTKEPRVKKQNSRRQVSLFHLVGTPCIQTKIRNLRDYLHVALLIWSACFYLPHSSIAEVKTSAWFPSQSS
jgi:hypothetical protein